jgi:Tol biopolymer transport system component
MVNGKISYSRESMLFVHDFDSQEAFFFDATPLMRASAWHPKGKKLAYGINTVYLLDLVANEVKPVNEADDQAGYPAWHPTEEILLYGLSTVDSPNQLCLHNLETGQKSLIPLKMQALQPAWHPAGQIFSFVGLNNGSKHIYKADITCLGNESCPDAAQQLTFEGRFNHAPAWSPNGELLAFERYIEAAGYWAIMLTDANGQHIQQVTPAKINAHHPTWSKDGSYLAFEQEMENGPSHICVIRPDGSDYTILIEDGGLEPDWY